MQKFLDSPAAGFVAGVMFLSMLLSYLWVLAAQIPDKPTTAWQPPGSTIAAYVANPDADAAIIPCSQ